MKMMARYLPDLKILAGFPLTVFMWWEFLRHGHANWLEDAFIISVWAGLLTVVLFPYTNTKGWPIKLIRRGLYAHVVIFIALSIYLINFSWFRG